MSDQEEIVLYQNNKNKDIYKVLFFDGADMTNETIGRTMVGYVDYKEPKEFPYLRENLEFHNKFTKYEDPNQTKLELDEN